MRRAAQCFNQDQEARVEAAVAAAEAKTSAEIMPVVATASGRYDRPEDMVGLWTGLVAMVVVWFIYPIGSGNQGAWDAIAWEDYVWVALVAALVAGFVLGVVLASHIGWLRKLFTPHRQMKEEVSARARQAFFDNRIHGTAGGTGLLIYISLFERMASIIADDTVTEKLGQPALDALCDLLTRELRNGEPTEAICTVLAEAGDQLAETLPRTDDDINELPNTLVVID